MSAQPKDPMKWYVPPVVAFQLLVPLTMVGVSLASSALLAIDFRHTTTQVASFVISLLGVGLMFIARLPLYRERRWFTFGPKHLTGVHRRLYFAAYAFLAIGVAMMLAMICFAAP